MPALATAAFTVVRSRGAETGVTPGESTALMRQAAKGLGAGEAANTRHLLAVGRSSRQEGKSGGFRSVAVRYGGPDARTVAVFGEARPGRWRLANAPLGDPVFGSAGGSRTRNRAGPATGPPEASAVAPATGLPA